MPGELITADWQLELQGLLHGAGTPYEIDQAGISGLGMPTVKTRDVELAGDDGDHPSGDFLQRRDIVVRFLIREDSTDDAFIALATLLEAWDTIEDDDELVELHLRLPGFGHRYLEGRPRQAEAAAILVRSGEIDVDCVFHGLNPRWITFEGS